MTAVFPDTTVLCNFAAVNRVDLVKDFLRGRGRWTEAVAYEVGRSAGYWPALRQVDRSWMGEPIDDWSGGDIHAIERLRADVFGGSQTQPLKHLGEAQTCHLFASRPKFRGAWWVTDDVDAHRMGKHRGAHALTTVDFMREMVADYTVTASTGHDLLCAMFDADRPVTPPGTAANLR